MNQSVDFYWTVRRALAGETPDPAYFLERPADADLLAVYRNNRAVALADALSRSYPAVTTLVGEAFMRVLAIEFARRHPPCDPVLALYGQGLADFIGGFPPLASLDYLAGIARLDRAWTEVSFASDAGLGSSAPAEGQPFALSARTRLLTLTWPVHDLWQSSRAGLAPPSDQLEPGRQSVLVWRGPEGMASLVLSAPLHDAIRGGIAGGEPLDPALAGLARRGAFVPVEQTGVTA